jgi:hypothetical protein
VTLKAPRQVPGVVASEKVTVTVPSHPSDTVGGLKVGVAGQLMGVVCATHVMVGGETSWTTIILLHVAVFIQSSVAVHVLVTLKVPVQEPGVVASEKVRETVPSQASLTVGGINTGVAGQAIGVVCVAQVKMGGKTSSTSPETLQDPVLPHSSVAVQVLVTK